MTSQCDIFGLGIPPERRLRGKRLFDVTFAAIGVVVISPVLAIVALLVKVTSRGPVIYKGQRVGLGGQEFEILKFRTMWDKPSSQLTTALNDQRITPVGHWLRRHKLDELPQLVNILRGEMSIVGPRPEFKKWVALYGPAELAVLSVRPGITDFASVEFIDLDQVVGATEADEQYLAGAFVRKNELRVRYLHEMSWRTDLRLIVMTLKKMLQRR